ncbi:MAG: flippase-like domain-containing protein [Thermoanaerobaculum sp.]|nr:flippase-like domain-containing protein [Thermoanaerobaculum sp.]MDW7966742.1 lysylphosphatidylglycerol synthase transmembrane domain-containing protein [Thermoanaerobaculum sp.]
MGQRAGSRAWQITLSLLVASLLLWLFFRQAPLAEVGQVLREVRWQPLIAATACALASYAARAWRWGLILSSTGSAPYATLFGCTAAGFATSALLPARLGELVRPLLLSSRTRLPAAATLASIVAERLLDLVTLVGLFAVALLARWQGQQHLVPSLLWTLLAVMVLAVGVAVLVRARQRLLTFLEAKLVHPWGRRLLRFLTELLQGLSFWGNPRHALALGFGSLITWGLAIGQVAMTAWAFAGHLSPRQATLVLALSVVGLAVPTPGGVGGFHAATQIALMQVASWPAAAATAFALIHHAICFVPITVVGFGYMLLVGFSWELVKREKP